MLSLSVSQLEWVAHWFVNLICFTIQTFYRSDSFQLVLSMLYTVQIAAKKPYHMFVKICRTAI